MIRSKGEKGKLILLWFSGGLKEETKQLEAQLFSLEGAFSGTFFVASLLIFTYHSVFFSFSLVISNFLGIVKLFLLE